MTHASNSGHPTTCASIAELLAVLFFDASGMHYDAKDPRNSFTSDRFVLSKGHAAPILYAAWAENGFIPIEELLNLRKITSDLEGHPTPILPFVDVATGSLGQGLGCASGMAYASKYFDKLDNHYWVVIGDGESAEGSIWEAANFASYYQLSNLTCIVDVNRLGQSQETSLGHDTEIYRKRFEAFGWDTIVIDGHNIPEIIEAYKKARSSTKNPVAVIAKTIKGKYLKGIEDANDWHGKPVVTANLQEIVKNVRDLVKNPDAKLTPTPP
jgi:transketolase